MRNLDKSISINGLTLKNRLVMPPMATSSADDGEVSQRILDYYDKKTKGGYIGLVITEHSYIDIQGMANPKQMSVAKDSDIKAIGKYNSKQWKQGVCSNKSCRFNGKRNRITYC